MLGEIGHKSVIVFVCVWVVFVWAFLPSIKIESRPQRVCVCMLHSICLCLRSLFFLSKFQYPLVCLFWNEKNKEKFKQIRCFENLNYLIKIHSEIKEVFIFFFSQSLTPLQHPLFNWKRTSQRESEKKFLLLSHKVKHFSPYIV